MAAHFSKCRNDGLFLALRNEGSARFCGRPCLLVSSASSCSHPRLNYFEKSFFCLTQMDLNCPSLCLHFWAISEFRILNSPGVYAMSTTVSLPPSYRDFEIYERVVIEAASTRQAAGQFSLSQTRIRQIVQRVSRWLTESLPPQDDATDAAYLRHAQHVAAERLTFFYGQAMDGWRAERQMKYMNLAIRVALAQSKLCVIPGTLECLAADAIEGPLPDVDWGVPTRGKTERQRDGETEGKSDDPISQFLLPSGSPPSPPPLRDCSAAPGKTKPAEESSAAPIVAKPTPPSSSTDLPAERAAARRAFLAPAHPAPLTGDLPVTELKITPQELGLAGQKKLSRRERRKLQRAKARA